MIFFLANLSIIEITEDNLAEASALSVAKRIALIALRVVLCWYLFNTLFFSLLLILLKQIYDLPFCSFFNCNNCYKLLVKKEKPPTFALANTLVLTNKIITETPIIIL